MRKHKVLITKKNAISGRESERRLRTDSPPTGSGVKEFTGDG